MIPETTPLRTDKLIKCIDCKKYHSEVETIEILDWYYRTPDQNLHFPEYKNPTYVCKGCLEAYIKRNEGI